MPPTVNFSKRHESDRTSTGAQGTAEVHYIAVATGTGKDDISEIRTAAEADLPSSFDGLPSRTIAIEPINAEDGLWDVVASYRPQAQEQTGPPPAGADSEYNFEVAANTVHITQSKATVGVFVPTGGTPPTATGAIGLTADGVEGCDIIVPESRWSETHFLAESFVDAGYRGTLRNLVGKVNNATFRGHAAGEVLFTGVTGSKRRSDKVWQLSYQFAYSPNATGLTVGDIASITKGGWEYLWVYYEPVVSAHQIIQRPAVVFVERVYDSGNFGSLGI